MLGKIDRLYRDIEHKPGLQILLLALIVLFASALRFFRLGRWSFWIDEVYTLNRVLSNYGSLGEILRALPNKIWFTLSSVLTGGVLNSLGISEWSARLAPTIIGILTIVIFYFLVKKLFGWEVGLLTALLLAVAPWHIYWSQNARFYTSLLLLYSLALFAFFYAIERDRPAYIFLGFFLLYFAVSERFTAFFLVPVIASYILLLKLLPFEKPPGLRLRNIFLMALIPAIGIILIEGSSFIKTGSSYFYQGSLISSLRLLVPLPIDDPLRLLNFIVAYVGLPLICLGFAGGLYLISKRSRVGLLLLIGALIPIILLLLLNPFVKTQARYVFLTLPSWVILAAIAVKELFAMAKGQRRLLAIGVLVVLVFSAASAYPLYYQINNGNRRDWRGAFELVNSQSGPDDIVVATYEEMGEYYLDRDVLVWRNLQPNDLITGENRTWFVIDSDYVYSNGEMKEWVEKNGELIEVLYLRTTDEISLRIYYYDPLLDASSLAR